MNGGRIYEGISATDLKGRPRVFGRKVDIGCYESQIGGFVLIIR